MSRFAPPSVQAGAVDWALRAGSAGGAAAAKEAAAGEGEVVDLEEIGEPRWLVVLSKEAMSPSRYPRRPGIPAKRPL